MTNRTTASFVAARGLAIARAGTTGMGATWYALALESGLLVAAAWLARAPRRGTATGAAPAASTQTVTP